MLETIKANLPGYLRRGYFLLLFMWLLLPLGQVVAYPVDTEDYEISSAIGDDDVYEGKPHHRSRRVVGGEPDDGQLPCVVELRSFHARGFISCTATVVGSIWVLTAKHCIGSGNKYIYFLNLPNGQTINRAEVVRVYNGINKADFSLLRLHSRERSKTQGLLPPPLSFVPLSKADYGKDAVVIGFGRGSHPNPPHRRQVVIKSMRANKFIIHSGHTAPFTENDPEYVTRPGDSGGPLLYEGKVVGPLSYMSVWGGNRGADGHVTVASQKKFILTTMGLQWFSPPQARPDNDSGLFIIGGRMLCRVQNNGSTRFGTISSDSPLPGLWTPSDRNRCHFFSNLTPDSTDQFEVAYAPYLHKPVFWRSPDIRWQTVEGKELPANATPVDWDDKGKPLYLCYTGQHGINHLGTLSSVASGCSAYNAGSGEPAKPSQLWVMTYSPQTPDTDHWMLIKDGSDSTSNPSCRYSFHHTPCRRANGQHLQMGTTVGIGTGSCNCRIDGTDYSTYELATSGLTGHRAWQSNREAFYDYRLGALGAGEDYYANPGVQKTFCRINGNQVGAVDLKSDTPVCRINNDESSLEFELFSRVLPLPDNVVEQTAPPWQIVITAEDKHSGKKYYCNGVKISDWLVVTSSECTQGRTVERYNYQLTGVNNRETWPVSKVLSSSCRTKKWDSDCKNLSLLVSRRLISGRDNAPLVVARFYKKQPMVRLGYPDLLDEDGYIIDLPRSTGLLSTLKFEPEHSIDSSSIYFSLKQPLTPGNEPKKLIYHPDYTNYYRLSGSGNGLSKSVFPLFRNTPVPGSLLPSEFSDTQFITTAAPLVITLGNEVKLLGLGLSIPAERIRNFIQPHTVAEAKLVFSTAGTELGESEPCWLKPENYTNPDGFYNNESCLLKDNIRASSFYQLETSPGNEYQWISTDNAQKKPNNASTFGYSSEGSSVVLAKNGQSSELKSEDRLQAGDQVLTLTKITNNYDRGEWHHCPNDQWPCPESLSIEIRPGEVRFGREGWCRERFNFEWLTGRYRKSCQVKLPDTSVRTGDVYSRVMKKPRFYRRYDVEPVWSHKPDSALLSSLFRMEPDNDSQEATYLCRRGIASAKHHNNKNLCKQILGDTFIGNNVVIERLLKHYPPNKSHYPEWTPIADGEKILSPGAWDDWWEDPGYGYLCLKVDVVENILYLGHVFPEDAGYCKRSRDESTKAYPQKRKRSRDYMVLKNNHYQWRSGIRGQIPETAVIAQRHPQKGNASEFVCRSGQSHQSGKTSLDQKHCLIGLGEKEETNFDVLVMMPPTKPPTGNITTIKSTNPTENPVTTGNRIGKDEWTLVEKMVASLTIGIYVATIVLLTATVREWKKGR